MKQLESLRMNSIGPDVERLIVEELISKITDKLGSELGGKIFVLDVPVAVDIRTKKRGEDAI